MKEDSKKGFLSVKAITKGKEEVHAKAMFTHFFMKTIEVAGGEGNGEGKTEATKQSLNCFIESERIATKQIPLENQ